MRFLVDRQVPRHLKSRTVFDFWSVITASFSSNEEIKERNWGASMLADERDAIEEELQREMEPHERVVVAVDCREEKLGCCARRCQFRVSYRFRLEREITSLFYI